MKTYLLTLAYDGTHYHGWQRQKGIVSVQECLETALASLVGAPVPVTASGRTDEGVHAVGQAVSFSCETSVPAQKFAAALNAKLPPDIRALSCCETADGFCARKAAKRKTYAYRFYLSPHVLPHIDGYALRVYSPLDTKALAAACSSVKGTHDFVCFQCLGSSAKTTVRTVYDCTFISYPAHGLMPITYEFRICGNGFLYKMVRLMAGALLRLSQGKITARDFAAALNGERERVAKIPLPGKGLTLVSVEYDQSDFAQI